VAPRAYGVSNFGITRVRARETPRASARLRKSVALRASSGREVLVDDRPEDQHEAEHSQRIDVHRALVARTEKSREQLVQRKQHERGAEGEKQPVRRLAPEAHEEQPRDQITERDRTGEIA